MHRALRAARMPLVAAALSVAATAHADDAVRLSKADAEALVVGKKVWYLRARDSSKVSWDFKSDGSVYYATPNTTRNAQISGTYTVTDKGSVCFKWNPDKFLPMQDGCVAFTRDGDKTHVVAGNDASRVLGDVVSE